MNFIIRAHRRTTFKEATVPKKTKFTRIPKVNDLIECGVPTEAILKEKGLIEFVERRRNKGRFSSYLYRIIHIVSSSASLTTGHGSRAVRRGSIYKRTKPPKNPPHSPPKEGYEWLFKEKEDPKSEAQHKRARQEERDEASKRRKDGYEWLFE
jgi:hypothetical protein